MEDLLNKKVLIDTSNKIKFELSNQYENTAFSRAKVYVMYHGKNVNGSYISKESVERNINSIKNIPIVGEFNLDTENFQGHGGKVVISEDKMSYIETTKPFGVVPESAIVSWELQDDGKEYLVVDNVYIWNRYYEEVEALKSDEYGQSMEIEILNYHFEENDEVIKIDDFNFSALCILGIEKNGDSRVQPAFEGAKIITYSKNMIGEMREMLDDFKLSFQKDNRDKEGIENFMENEKKEIKEFAGEEKEDVLIQDTDGDVITVEEKDKKDSKQEDLDLVDDVKRDLEDIIETLNDIVVEESEKLENAEYVFEGDNASKVNSCIEKIDTISEKLKSSVNSDEKNDDAEKEEFSADVEEPTEEEKVEEIKEAEAVEEEAVELEQKIEKDLEEDSVEDEEAVEEVEKFDSEKEQLRLEVEALRKELRGIFEENANNKINEFKDLYELDENDLSSILIENFNEMSDLENALYMIVGKKVATQKNVEDKNANFSQKIFFNNNEDTEDYNNGKSYAQDVINVIKNKKRK